MNNKEKIIKATTELVSENPDCLEKITIREISKRANVGIRLINYHFEIKEKLIEICVENIISGIVAKFSEISEQTKVLPPFERLVRLGNITLAYLFEHRTVSKISELSNMNLPCINDNTHSIIVLEISRDKLPDKSEFEGIKCISIIHYLKNQF